MTATHTTAGFVGGAISVAAIKDVSNSLWSLANVTASHTMAGEVGGAVSLRAINVQSSSTWSVARVTATHTTAGEVGGAVSLFAVNDVSRSAWWVANVTATHTSAGGFGGAVSLSANYVKSNSTWSVAGISATNTTAGGFGGAVSLYAINDVSGSTWSVERIAAANTKAGGSGGIIALQATKNLSRSTWSVAHVTALKTSAERGGVLSLHASRVLDSMCSLSSLQMKASRAATGGGMYVSIQSAERAELYLSDWHATDVSAREGAVGAVSHATPLLAAATGLEVLATRLRVVRAHATQSGGILAVHSGRPLQIPWRTRASSICAFPGVRCTLPYFNSSAVPLVYAVQVSASDWDVSGISATSGALAVLDNANASFSGLQVRHVNVTSAGGLWTLSGYTALSVENLSATIQRASANARGLLLDQSQSPGNLSLSNVSARLEDGPLLDSGIQTWIHAGALTPTALTNVFFGCPAGATLHNASLGRLHLTESPFTTIEETLSTSGLVNRSTSTAKAFPYTTTSLGCRVCPEGKYLLARLAWVSSDVDGAVCNPDLDVNVTMPLCPNAPSSRSSCVGCPRGATCHGGANVTAQVGRWGTMSPDDADRLIRVFPLLQFGYACSSRSCQQRFDSCAGNRTGFACGRCRQGFGEALGSPECGPDAECRNWEHCVAWVAFPLGCIAAAALFLHSADAKSDGVTSGLTTILFVLFQSEAIIRTHDADKASTLSHLAMFQISLPAARVCLWPGMSARAKALVPLGTYAGILGALGLFYVAHWLLHRRWWVGHAPSARRYQRALVSLLLVSYGAIANVCFKLVTRTEIDGAWYQSLTGERWMATADQWMALVWLVTSTVPTPFWFWYGLAHLRVGTMSDVTFGLGLLSPVPAALWPWLTRRRHFTWGEKEAARDLHRTLAAPYGERFWYWEGVFLAQRLVLGLISVSLASHLLYKAYAMTVVAVVLALTYTLLHVFATFTINVVHTAALVALLLVCSSNGVSAYTYQHGYIEQPDLMAVDRCSTWCARAVPLAAIAAKLIQRRRDKDSWKGKRGGWSTMQVPTLRWRRMKPDLSAPLMEGQDQ